MKNPFLSLKQEPVPVVKRPDGTFVHFISTGYISPDTNPIALQEKQKKQAQMTVLFLEASEEMARRKGISSEQAREMFSPKRSSTGETTIVTDPLDYLNTDQKILYFSLAAESEEIPIVVATLMMRSRLAFDIVLSEPAKAKAKQLYTNEPWFDVHVGDCFKFGSVRIQVAEPYDPESGAIGVTAIASPLEVGSVGLLLNSDRKTYHMGNRDWLEQDTRSLSLETADGSESQITAIYKFYLKEAGKLVVEDEKEAEGKSEIKNQPLLNSSNAIALTGEASTGESSPIKLQTNGSAPKTLEAVPTG